MIHIIEIKPYPYSNYYLPLYIRCSMIVFLLHHTIGLDRTGHMSFLTGQDRTPKFAGQVLPDRTKSGLIFLNILPTKYGL